MTAPAVAEDPRERLRRAWLVFPAVVLMLFAMLVALDLNGSSISLLVPPGQRVGLLAGEPRPIRSDELLLRTPIAISSVEQGFPGSPWIGLAQTDQAAVAHGGPTLEWTTLFKPQDWGYLVLGPSRGLAVSWWWSFTVSLLGCFALFGLITRSPGLAALLAIAATFTPYSAWWTAPAPSLFLGYAAGIGALLVAAWSVARKKVAAIAVVGAAAVSIALALALYPPWQVSLAWVVALACLGVALDRRLSWPRIAWTTAATVALAGVGVAAWYLDHSGTITAVLGTYYPGNRLSPSGGTDLAVVMDAPLSFWLARHPGATLGTTPGAGPYANLSEASATWLSLPVLVVVAAGSVLALAAQLKARRAQASLRAGGATEVAGGPAWTVTLLSIAAGLMLAWAFLPLPNVLGVVTQLDRVQPSRVILALGLAALLQAAAASMIQPRSFSTGPWLAAAAALTGATALWADAQLPWDASLVPAVFVVISGLLVGTGFALLTSARWATAGAATLAVLAVTSWGLVNPLQRGLGGVSTDPVVTELRSRAAPDANRRVEVFGDASLVAKVRIAGLQSLGGTTLQPDAALMGRLVPRQEALWNNYATYLWSPGRPGSPALITQVKGTLMRLDIDPCDPVLLQGADPGWAISAEPLVDASCLHQVSTVRGFDGHEYLIYQVSPPA